jgi:hypothetical protein
MAMRKSSAFAAKMTGKPGRGKNLLDNKTERGEKNLLLVSRQHGVILLDVTDAG